MVDIENKKAEDISLKLHLCFYKEIPKPHTWGSSDKRYDIYYHYNDGIMQVFEIGAFGDSTLVARFQDKRGRGITEKEMLENIQELTNMTYKEFKEKILQEK